VFRRQRPHPLIAAGLSTLRYFPGVGATTGTISAFPFPPLRYSTFKLYLEAASGFLLWRARAALMMSFDQEVEAAFGFAEGAVVVGLAGDGGAIPFGAAVGFEGAQVGFELGLELMERRDSKR
jgi:hypothetical protein